MSYPQQRPAACSFPTRNAPEKQRAPGIPPERSESKSCVGLRSSAQPTKPNGLNHSRRQVVPLGLSSITTPRDFNSLRKRSAKAHSFSARAAFLA